MAYLYCQRNEDDKVLYNELVNVAEFINSWTEMSNFDFRDNNTVDEHIKTMMSLDDEALETLNQRCGEENLVCCKPSQIKRYPDTIPENVELMTLKLQKHNVKKKKTNHFYRNVMTHRERNRNLFTHTLSPVNIQPPSEDRIVTPDAILQVVLYKPSANLKNYVTRSLAPGNAYLENVYAVLGQQVLTELKDRIRCVNDVLVTGDYSENPDLNMSVCAWDVFKSGAFFIENILYDDTRQPENLRYSKEIVEWAAESGIHYECKIMENTKFNKLSVRIGCPYLYVHQGNCEHLVVFSDIRMVHPHDNLSIQEYPCMIQRSHKKRTICNVCAYASARWRTVESEHALENTSFFCDACFRSLHYDKDGKKLGNFKAYKYFDGHTVL